MNEIKILVGVSGSGKSTWSSEFIKNNSNWVRVNRDDIRKQLVGILNQDYYKRKDLNSLEKQVTFILEQNIRHLLSHNYNIIIDNTHLKESYINDIYKEFGHLAKISVKVFNTPLEECKSRVVKRETKQSFWDKLFGRKVNFDTSYIDKQFKDLSNLLKKYNTGDFSLPVLNHEYKSADNLPKCIIIDLDGTLCLYGDKNPYDRDFENDICNPVVKKIMDSCSDNIIFFSGRNDKFKNQTIEFLEKHFSKDFKYQLFMRNTKDNRNDVIVKEEMFNNYIRDKYQVEFAIDDRLRILRLWNKLGITTINMNQLNNEF